jgi:hypothetical protein
VTAGEGDKEFFDARPKRHLRLRLAHPDERAGLRAPRDASVDWFVVVTRYRDNSLSTGYAFLGPNDFANVDEDLLIHELTAGELQRGHKT